MNNKIWRLRKRKSDLLVSKGDEFFVREHDQIKKDIINALIKNCNEMANLGSDLKSKLV